MNNIISIIILLFFVKLNGQNVGSGVTDIDGNYYNTVIIGDQEWMSENLKTTKYCNGDVLPINNNNSTGTWGNLTVGAWNYGNPNSSIYPNEKFYNWYAASDSRNICPCDWHVPSDSEWTILENYLIANGFNYDNTTFGNKIAKAIASQNTNQNINWLNSTNLGSVGNITSLNNSSGFNALPFGLLIGGNNYGYNSEKYAFWWTSNEWNSDNTYALWRGLSYQSNYLWSGAPDIGFKDAGFSIRCVKNSSLNTENQSKSQCKIFPNPTNNYLHIQLPFFGELTKFNIIDTAGKILLKGEINNENYSIDLTDLQSGIYFISISNSTVSKTQKFIKL